MSYFVVAPNGQKFGPAEIDILNQWISEGRIMPDTLLEEAGTGAQLVARAIPGLSFLAPGQAPIMAGPAPAPPDANPYLTPLPNQYNRPAPGPGGYYGPPTREIAGVANGQIVAAWVGTFIAPLIVWFCYLGLAPILFGIITGIQLKRQGENQGVALVAINAIWLIGWLLVSALMGFRF